MGNKEGVYGIGTTDGAYGVFGIPGGTSAAGVRGDSGYASSPGVVGAASSSYGVQGLSESSYGVYGSSQSSHGVYGTTSASSAYAGYFKASSSGSGGKGVYVDGDIDKSGSNNFVVPHPFRTGVVIRYVSLEAGEAGTYCRGKGRLVRGRARIDLPEHFTLVTAEEGLTVQVTLTAPCGGLYVARSCPDSFEVVELGEGTSDATFDYFVLGIRKGYEDYEPVADDPELYRLLPSTGNGR
jgi:hypothetical protein